MMRHWIMLAASVACFLAACASKQASIKPTSTLSPILQRQKLQGSSIFPDYALPANQPYQVDGKWYYPLRSFDFYDALGIASWYGPDFDGKMTSSGETYNMEGLTAAHRLLPIPSLVRVTSLSTGRSIVVKVNDRGPFVGNREIDLSYGAAKALGIADKGLALVHVELLPSSTALAQTSSDFYLQAGSFKEAENAKNMRQQLAAYGFKNAKIISGQSHYRVVVGPYRDPEEAHAAQNQLRQTLGINAVFSAGE